MLETVTEMFEAIKGGTPRLISKSYEIAKEEKALNDEFFGKKGTANGRP